jgi:Ala-tRNA(Pro) deacylase
MITMPARYLPSHRPVSRDDLLATLTSLRIATVTYEHAPVFTVEQARALRGEIPGAHCKNLFLKDKGEVCWLVVCLEDTRVDLKGLPARLGSNRLSFGKPDLLRQVLGVDPGSVTPFALINAAPGSVQVVLEEAMMACEVLNYHPLQNSATTSIASADLLKFIRACGHSPRILPLA